MAAKVLIIEDEQALVELLRYNLKAEGFEVVSASDGEEALLLIEEELPDLVLLDWMLPDLSGIEICRRLRQRPETTSLPILMLTARGEESDKVRGLATGADDYVVKPFSVPELMARVKAMLRRAVPERVAQVLTAGQLTMDRAAHKVTRGARLVRLGPTEYRLLEALMESAGRVLSRDQLIDRAWGTATDIDDRTVDVHIGRLRKALIRGNEVDPIRTVRGVGYALEEDVG